MNVTAIIPAYKAENTITRLIEEIEKYIPPERILVINDGSPDNTGELISNTRVQSLHLSPNKGKGGALRAGFDYLKENGCDSDYILLIDSDLQHKPKEIPLFIEKVKETGADMIIGKRDMSLKVMPPHRIMSNRIVSIFTSMLIWQWIPDCQCGFRLISREKLLALNTDSDKYQIEVELILEFGRKGFKIASIPIDTIYETGNVSYIRGMREIRNIIILFWRYITNGKKIKNSTD